MESLAGFLTYWSAFYLGSSVITLLPIMGIVYFAKIRTLVGLLVTVLCVCFGYAFLTQNWEMPQAAFGAAVVQGVVTFAVSFAVAYWTLRKRLKPTANTSSDR